MLRGINRQVLEITETNNLYYEKAFLVIKPEYTSAQQAVLEREAKIMLKRMKPPSAISLKAKVVHLLPQLVLSALFGAGITMLIVFL